LCRYAEDQFAELDVEGMRQFLAACDPEAGRCTGVTLFETRVLYEHEHCFLFTIDIWVGS
jgi:hypothetical protein